MTNAVGLPEGSLNTTSSILEGMDQPIHLIL